MVVVQCRPCSCEAAVPRDRTHHNQDSLCGGGVCGGGRRRGEEGSIGGALGASSWGARGRAQPLKLASAAAPSHCEE